jgi:hypothetical protein
VAAAQFAPLANEALVVVVGKAVGGLEGKRGVAKIDGGREIAGPRY